MLTGLDRVTYVAYLHAYWNYIPEDDQKKIMAVIKEGVHANAK